MNEPLPLPPKRRWFKPAAGILLGGLLAAALSCGSYLMPLVRYAQAPEVLVVPVEGMARSSIRSGWGSPRSGGRKHRGVDLFALRGTPVLSATRGVVWKVGNDSLGGKVVTVLGEGRAFYYYAHLEGWAEGLERGDLVAAGQVLGYVGNSGNAVGTPPHLHFGVYRIRGFGVRAVDPAPLLVAAGGKVAARR